MAPNRIMTKAAAKSELKTRVNVRFDEQVWARIDRARNKRAGFVSRNSWILEAVMEKLAKEQDDNRVRLVKTDA